MKSLKQELITYINKAVALLAFHSERLSKDETQKITFALNDISNLIEQYYSCKSDSGTTPPSTS